MNQVSSYVTEVDVKKAEEFLRHNVFFGVALGRTNRPVSRQKVSDYAEAMLRGEWRLTHQGIGFDINGKLVDGQSRLLAIVKASETNPNISITMQVTEGLDLEVFDSIDIGRNRNGIDVLALRGEVNRPVLASSLRMLWLYDNMPYRLWRSTRVTNHLLLETLDKTPEIKDYMINVGRLAPIGLIPTVAVVGPFVCERKYAPAGTMLEFLDAIQYGADLPHNDPRLVFRNFLAKSRQTDRASRRARYDSSSHLAMFIKIWNDFVLGRTREQISWKSTEDMPKPIERK